MLSDAGERIEFLDFNPFDHAFRDDPYRFYPTLLEQSPTFVKIEGVPSALVCTYAQNQNVLRNFKAFSSLKPKGLPGMERLDVFNGLPVMNYSDPPEHVRRRKIVNPAFTPKRTALLNEQASILIDRLLNGVAKHEQFDVMADLAQPLAKTVVLEHFMGIGKADHHNFDDFVNSLRLLDGLRAGDPKPPAYLAGFEKMKAYCRGQQELARRGESTSLIGVVAESAEGGALNENEMLAMMLVLLIGGVATTAAGATVALMNVARTPGLAERIRNQPQLAGNVLEESLRLDPPIAFVMRFATDDMEIGGKRIPKGMPVYAMNGASCYDPAVFRNPATFDPDRANVRDHLAFGYGMHTCIGNTIVRNVVPVLIERIVERFPSLRLADRPDPVVWARGSARVRHIHQLWLQG